MVWKKSKYGINTGNTLRRCHKPTYRQQFGAKDGTLTKEIQASPGVVNEWLDLYDFPTDIVQAQSGTELSLGKRNRFVVVDDMVNGYLWNNLLKDDILLEVTDDNKPIIKAHIFEAENYLTSTPTLYTSYKNTTELETITCRGVEQRERLSESRLSSCHLPDKGCKNACCKQCGYKFTDKYDKYDLCPKWSEYREKEVDPYLHVNFVITRLSNDRNSKCQKLSDSAEKLFKKRKGSVSKGYKKDFLLELKDNYRHPRTRNPRRHKFWNGRSGRMLSVDHSQFFDEQSCIFNSHKFPNGEEVVDMMKAGDTDGLEDLVLAGRATCMHNKSSHNSKTKAFLKSLSNYEDAVQRYLSAICSGDLDKIKESSGYKKTLQATHPTTGTNGIHLSVIYGQPEILKYLMRKLPTQVINDFDYAQRTALHYAACSGNSRLLYNMLIQGGADPNLKDKDGLTPTVYSEKRSYLDMVKIRALNLFADPIPYQDEVDMWIRTNSEEELRRLVLWGGGERVLNRLFPVGADPMYKRLNSLQTRVIALQEAASEGDLHVFKQLLDKSDLASMQTPAGRSLLHLAVARQQFAVTEYLIQWYKDIINIADKDGRTPLHYAANVPNDRSFYRIILNSGADKSKTDKAGKSPEDYLKNPDVTVLQFSSNTLGVFHAKKTVARPNTMTGRSSSLDVSTPREEDVSEWVQQGNLTRLNSLLYSTGKEDIIASFCNKHSEVADYVKQFRSNMSKLAELSRAIESGELVQVKNLIKRYKKIDYVDAQGRNVIHIATVAGQRDIVGYLGEEFPNLVNVTDNKGRTALHLAAADESAKDIYEILESVGADPSLEDKNGFTAEEYVKDSSKFVAKTPALDTRSSMSDFSNSKMDSGSDIRDHENAEPTTDMISEWLDLGDVELLERLVLDGRGDLLKDKTSTNLKSQEFLDALLQYQLKIEAIHRAVEQGDVRRVRSLIDRSKLAIAKDKKGLTPLHKAVLHGQTDTIRYMLRKFPQIVNATDNLGRTALHLAAADKNGGHFVKLLQKSGADGFLEDHEGHTPFYYKDHPEALNISAIKDAALTDQLTLGELPRPLLQDLEDDIEDWLVTGNVGKLEELMLNGYGDLLLGRVHHTEDKNTLDFLEVLPQYQGKITAIHKAVKAGNLRDVKNLIDRKKLAFARDSKGATPLHNAVLHMNLDIVQYLLCSYPQATNAQDQNRKTPLHFAAALQDNGAMYKLLRKFGADPTLTDSNGRTAKYYMRHPGEMDIDALRMDTHSALRQALLQRVAPSYLESSISQWLREGNTGKLEQLVTSGCGDLLVDRETTNPDSIVFMDKLSELLEDIEKAHKYVREGHLKDLVRLVEQNKRLAVTRDRKGATPLHNAILYEQTDVLRFITQSFSGSVNAPDYNKRTPLHYAGAARDGGHYLKILEKAGADSSLVDNEGHTADFYHRNPGTLDLRMIRDRDRDFVPDLDDYTIEDSLEESRHSSLSQISRMSTPYSHDLDDLSRHTSVDGPDLTSLERARAEFDKAFDARLSNSVNLADRRLKPTTENGIYLARTVGPVLTKALADVLMKRPADPIGYLADSLFSLHQANIKSSDSGVDDVPLKQPKKRSKKGSLRNKTIDEDIEVAA